jgi:GTP-binding protein Era
MRCGVVAVLGAPNAGKSTLVNALVGTKVSIVTHKVQTTRFRVRGIAVREDAQIILVDTPGVFQPKKRLDRAMVEDAWAGLEDADAIIFVIDAEAQELAGSDRTDRKAAMGQKAHEHTQIVAARLKAAGKPIITVLNKMDVTGAPRLLPMIDAWSSELEPEAIIPVSATRGEGLEALMDEVIRHLPEGPFLYPVDQAGDLSMRALAAEVTREKLFLRLHDELPYETTVETEDWKDLKDGAARIEQIIYVNRESQKPIVLGDKGRSIREIGKLARLELEEMLGRQVHLFVHVKVRSGWRDEPERYRAMGLTFPQG